MMIGGDLLPAWVVQYILNKLIADGMLLNNT